ncbi:MAG: PAAR domain-containing protein [Telluria sp.]
MNWLLKGLLIGAGLALAGVLIAGTGGLAAAAIVGGVAATGAGVGELMSTMSWAPKEVVGALTVVALNVFTNGKGAARSHVDFGVCSKHPSPDARVATGSDSVFINGLPAVRVDDKTICSAVVTKGSGNVFIGGGIAQTDVIQDENLVPGWVHASLLVVGIGPALLAAPVLALVGLAAGTLGALGGSWIGGKVFGEGSDGQKWSLLGGSVLGGIFGVKAAGAVPRLWRVPPRQPMPGDPDFIGPLTKLDSKILFGEGKPGTNNIIGGHSPDVLTSPNYQMNSPRITNPDGTVSVKGFKGQITRKDDTIGLSKSKSQHTIAPPSWNNGDVLRAGAIAAARRGKVIRNQGGVKTTVHTATVNGVKWVVIKENGVVTSSFPTGGKPFP